jgi:deazaflavin-dependent oxidoreductase (nitroreductase family)
MTTAPTLVRYTGPITRRLLGLGVPMGPNTILTVRGRVSGQPRTAPVAVVEIDGRRWIIGMYGDVHWVRNLRAARKAEVRIDGRMAPFRAVELDRKEAAAFFRDTLIGYVGALPFLWRVFTRLLIRLSAPEIVTDPERAASSRPVFELHPIT